MPTPRQILVSSADQNDWANLYTACLANNIDMSIVFASPAFQNGSVGQQCGCMFDALTTCFFPPSKKAASSKKHGKKHIDKEIKKQTNSTQLLLKPTPMGRIVKDVIRVEGKKFSGGIGWEKTPRQTRNTIHQSVTRKTKGSVEAISEEAQNLLVNVFSSANEATSWLVSLDNCMSKHNNTVGYP